MARIRTIKPEFWTDEKLSECSLSAHLLFMGLISFADDDGRMEYQPARIRMQIFPCGRVAHGELIECIRELSERSVIRLYTVDGKDYLDIPNFRKHQKINRPTQSKLPGFSGKLSENSVSAHGGKGKERKGSIRDYVPVDESTGSSEKKPKANGLDRNLEQQILDAYHELLPDLPRVRDWNDRRHRKLAARIRERAAKGADKVDYWRRVFDKAARSDFLCGRKTDWRCSGLEWLLEPKNFTKLIEGAYDNTGAASG